MLTYDEVVPNELTITGDIPEDKAQKLIDKQGIIEAPEQEAPDFNDDER